MANNPFGFRARSLFVAALSLLAFKTSLAQEYLVVEHKGQGAVVRKVHNGFVFIMEGDKLISVTKDRLALVKAPEFLPLFISVRNLEVKSSGLSLNGGSDINNTFHLRANFESPYVVPDAFLVIELHPEDGSRQIFYQEIGTLTPSQPRTVEAHVPLSWKLGEGKYQLHLFTDGREVFHSQQPWQYREHALDKMVRKRIAGVADAPPQPFVGPSPEYPKKLRKGKVAGSAQVGLHITPTGVVTEPKLESATDPAFGEAALEAVRQWRFLPRIKGGHAVETDASMPFVFAAPAEPEKN